MASDPLLEGLDVQVREEDHYVNITSICRQASLLLGCRKNPSHWLVNDRTRESVRRVQTQMSTGQPVVQLGKSDKRKAIWVHPSLVQPLYQWLSQRSLRPQRCSGMVYLVHSALMSVFKIGIWTAEIKGLRKRYATYYGPECQLIVWQCEDYKGVEKKAIRQFEGAQRGSELFDISVLDACRALFDEECKMEGTLYIGKR